MSEDRTDVDERLDMWGWPEDSARERITLSPVVKRLPWPRRESPTS